MIRRVLCWLGFHEWEYTYEKNNKIKGTGIKWVSIEKRKHPKCKHCGRIKE